MPITKEDADELKKHKVFYDYPNKNFEIDSGLLNSNIKKWKIEKKYKYVLVSFGFNSVVGNIYNDFTMAISPLEKAADPVVIIAPIVFSNSKWNSKSALNYNNAYNYLNSEGFLGVYGHKSKNNDGVIFPIDSVLMFINNYKFPKYFIYPSFKIDKMLKPNFTTVVFSSDSLLRDHIFSPLISDKLLYSYGDKGSTCCQ